MTESFQTGDATYAKIREFRHDADYKTYLVNRGTDQKQFILKALQVTDLQDWRSYDSFKRQIDILADLSYISRIPKLVDSSVDAETGVIFLVEENIEGVTLGALTSSHVESTEQIQKYLKSALEVLHLLHTNNPTVLHRNISPENIIIYEDEAYITDFSLAQYDEEDSEVEEVNRGAFVAPELIRGHNSPQGDLYSLGMSFVVVAQNLSAKIQSAQNSDQKLQRVLAALTHNDPSERLKSALDAINLLQTSTPESSTSLVLANQWKPANYEHLSPYINPSVFSSSALEAAKRHTLRPLPVHMALFAHFVTGGVFSWVYYAFQHDRLPRIERDDPSGAKVVFFSLVPIIQYYWFFNGPHKLADRLNFQLRLRDKKDRVSTIWPLVAFFGLFSFMGYPFLAFTLWLCAWGMMVYQLQSTINTLAEENTDEQQPELLP